jgi:sulfoxide reductase heme-binding subunit YedZ
MPNWSRLLVFFGCLAPFASLVWGIAANQLGPDPGEALMLATGEWGARLLMLCLLISPLRSWTGWSRLIQLRRMLGLYCFFYACLHFLLFMHFYLGWTVARLIEEVVERPYVTLGFLAWLLLLPLAITSTRAMQRRLRQRQRWTLLHRAVYVVALLISLHMLWQVRSDIGEALLYTAVFMLLLSWRLRRWRAAARPVSGGAQGA